MLKIGWFSTGRDQAARQLLQTVQSKIASGDIKAQISFVFSNREPGEAGESDTFFELVHSYSIPLICLSHRRFKTDAGDLTPLVKQQWRVEYDQELSKRIEPFSCDLCVLAGYMLIVSEELCQKYNMINLHPAPPGGPAGTWQQVIWSLIDNRADTAGAMMHLVTPELDRGPTVTYCLFSIKGNPFAEYWRRDDRQALFGLIREHELAREFPLITLTLQSFGRGEVSIRERRILDARGKPLSGYDLTSRVDLEVKDTLR